MNQLTNLKTRLKDRSLLVTKGYLAGEWTDGGNNATFEVINPSKGDVIANVADFSRAQVAKAISGDGRAQKSWAKLTGKERSKISNYSGKDGTK